VELHHLHVLERYAGPKRHRHPVAGARIGVGRPGVEAARTPRCEDDRLGADRLDAAVQEVPGDHALAAVVVQNQPPREPLLVDAEVPLHHLLVENLDEDMAGDIGGVGGSRRAGGSERTLRDPAVLGAREDGAPVLEPVDILRGLFAEDLDRVLVAQVVRALDRVVGMRFGVVLGGVAERGVDASLSRPGVTSNGMDLGDERDVRAHVVRLDRRTHPRAAGADDEHVVLRFHY
jgi:hypothetical protein